MTIVLDASVGVPLVHPEAGSERWRALAGAWRREGRDLVVPAHFWLEITNVLDARHRYAGKQVLEALHLLDDVVSETVEVGRPLLLVALDRAERLGLTLHDATYLALAETLDAELATADEALRVAAADRLADDGDVRRLSESPAGYDSALPTWLEYGGAASYLASLRARVTAGGRG